MWKRPGSADGSAVWNRPPSRALLAYVAPTSTHWPGSSSSETPVPNVARDRLASCSASYGTTTSRPPARTSQPSGVSATDGRAEPPETTTSR
ncbi:hypothetical protein ACFQ0B_45880 [Nonomuraea thailandensis]